MEKENKGGITMGYYSEVGIGMHKKDFERLIKKTKFHNADENDKIDAYNCLTKYCDRYYSDEYQDKDYSVIPPKPIGPVHEIVILHWCDIKLYSTGMNYIKDFLKLETKESAFLTWVGEAMDDVGYEEYNWEKSEFYWQEYIEPVSSISIETRGANSSNYKDFIEKIERRK